MIRNIYLAAALAVGLCLPGAGYGAEQVGWEDLEPPLDDFVDPFSELTDDQRYDLFDIFQADTYRAAGAQWDEAQEKQARTNLEEAGFDVEALLVEAREVDRILRIREETLIHALNGKVIKIAGYILPLEYDGTKTTEFLLVPYVGACIHTPPPPTNQIIDVITKDGYEVDGLFNAVWVTGRITTNATERNLYLVDGAADVSVGYAMDATLIEPYGD
jgi:hypothetical protein